MRMPSGEIHFLKSIYGAMWTKARAIFRWILELTNSNCCVNYSLAWIVCNAPNFEICFDGLYAVSENAHTKKFTFTPKTKSMAVCDLKFGQATVWFSHLQVFIHALITPSFEFFAMLQVLKLHSMVITRRIRMLIRNNSLWRTNELRRVIQSSCKPLCGSHIYMSWFMP